jgi:hypothetical protein
MRIPSGWFAQESSREDAKQIHPKGENAKRPVTTISVYVVVGEERNATRLFTTDEYVQTADDKQALIRFSFAHDSDSHPNPDNPRLNPRAAFSMTQSVLPGLNSFMRLRHTLEQVNASSI